MFQSPRRPFLPYLTLHLFPSFSRSLRERHEAASKQRGARGDDADPTGGNVTGRSSSGIFAPTKIGAAELLNGSFRGNSGG